MEGERWQKRPACVDGRAGKRGEIFASNAQPADVALAASLTGFTKGSDGLLASPGRERPIRLIF